MTPASMRHSFLNAERRGKASFDNGQGCGADRQAEQSARHGMARKHTENTRNPKSRFRRKRYPNVADRPLALLYLILGWANTVPPSGWLEAELGLLPQASLG